MNESRVASGHQASRTAAEIVFLRASDLLRVMQHIDSLTKAN